ncbi:hypothetical protein GCM10011338_09830 [Alteromonas lipolytica]|uniref:DUF6436 domain-containing protein n=2 Tax=Alteromonas lipolytica TaxID=1856405 RepID=A0A1E8FCD4_9ALTE|nr:hypothetical protein BFC17_04085 [Alteromonas lipolytica]GGF59621.1 hypothetical protein GCM10011338_09830 [Alteromonas lipolytica]
MSTRSTTIAVVVWAVGILSLLAFASVNQISAFDPEHSLAQAAAQPDFDQRFANELKAAGIAAGTLVHISSAGRCYCDELTESHRDELSAELKQQGYQLAQLSLAEHPAITRFVNHYPALAVVDNAGQLRYLGPYAIGYGCITGKNLVAEIRQLATASRYYGASINSDVKGCFCAA